MNNYDGLDIETITKGQKRILDFFHLHKYEKFTAHEVLVIFQKEYPNITINSIAPRISELVDEGLLVYDGFKTYIYTDPISGVDSNKKQRYARIKLTYKGR